jgi:homoserine kinase
MQARAADAVTAYAPGSSANLGPGFDCLGVALAGIGDRVRARRSDVTGVRIAAASDPRIPIEATRNTASLAAAAVLRAAGAGFGLELRVEKGLPLAGGLGGSAASAVAGALAAAALVAYELPVDVVLEAALEAEAAVAGRHADNVLACLRGGAVLIAQDPLRATRVEVHPLLRFVIAIPEYGVETALARSVVPEVVAREEAIAHAAHLARLVLGLERGDGALLGSCMQDRIAEPSRLPLVPGFVEAREAGLRAGAFGVALSGAGPTALALVPEGCAEAVADAMRVAYLRRGIASAVRVTEVDRHGARLVVGPGA